MHGIQRLPGLLFGQSNFNLESLHLDSYEIMTHEPLHDFMNYIKNLFKKLPLHLPKEKKKKSCVTENACTWLMEHLFNHIVTTLFITLSEIKEISYSSDDEVSQRLLPMTNLILQYVLIILQHS